MQVDTQLQEQLFKLYHNERQIDDLVEQVKTKQKELDKLVSLSLVQCYLPTKYNFFVYLCSSVVVVSWRIR